MLAIMRKTLKIAGLVAGGVLALLLAAVLIAAFTFDPDALKGTLVDRLQRDHQRTLAIADPIKLSLFPRIGVELGSLTVSEQGKPAPFASLKSARLALALRPLLSGEVVVDRIRVDGLQLRITRFKDGRTSIDDLIQPAQPEAHGGAASASGAGGSPPLRLDVAGVSLTDAALSLDDEQTGRRVALTGADFETGRLAPGRAGDVRFKGHLAASAPQVDADVSAGASLLFEPGRRLAISGFEAAAQGRLAGTGNAALKLKGRVEMDLAPWALSLQGLEISLESPEGPLALKAEVPAFRWAAAGAGPAGPQALEATLSFRRGDTQAQARLKADLLATAEPLRLSSTQTSLAVDGKQGEMAVRGSLGIAWSFDTALEQLAVKNLAVEASLPNPRGGALPLKAQGTLQADFKQQSAQAELAGTVDGSRFDTRLAATHLAPAALTLAAQIDKLDVDRYLQRPHAPGPGRAASPASDKPIDLSALQGLDASGSLRIGALQAAGLKASQLAIDWRAGGGKLVLNPIAAELYQGRLSGSAEVQAGAPARFSLQNQFTDVHIGPLLQDLTGKDPLTGRGTVSIDVHAEGATPAALQKALAGRARLELREGAVRGFNIGQTLRGLKDRIGLGGASHSGAGSQADVTDFSELGATLTIAHGIAHNDDLLAKSPLLRLAGSGDIDIGQGRLDYLVKATVVPSLQGQGGPELQALRGETIPVRLSGPFSAIGWKIELGDLMKDLAQQKLEQQLGQAKDRARQQLGDKLKGLLGR